MMTRIMSMKMAELKGKFYGTQAMATVEVIGRALYEYKWNSIEFKFDSILSLLLAEQPKMFWVN